VTLRLRNGRAPIGLARRLSRNSISGRYRLSDAGGDRAEQDWDRQKADIRCSVLSSFWTTSLKYSNVDRLDSVAHEPEPFQHGAAGCVCPVAFDWREP